MTDIIGDVHGCFDELLALLEKLGYKVRRPAEEDPAAGPAWQVQPPVGRKLVFVGDLVDRGPRVADVLRLVMNAVADRVAICVCGNHDDRLLRKLRGRDVRLTHGLADTLAQINA